LKEDLLNNMFEGRIDAPTLAGHIGADPAKPAVVAVFALYGTVRTAEPDRPARELRSAAIANLISVHAAAYRRTALTTTIGSRVYVLLPDLPGDGGDALALGLAREIVTAARKRLRRTVRAAVGSVADHLGGIAESRDTADRVMNVLIGGNPFLRDPRVTSLVTYDAEHGAELVPSLVAYLDLLGDVSAAARRLRVHPNTLRHRLKRVATVSGLDLSDPNQRLFAHLQLLLATTRRH
jgi:DNA-binding PucR family transcriptional regulator